MNKGWGGLLELRAAMMFFIRVAITPAMVARREWGLSEPLPDPRPRNQQGYFGALFLFPRKTVVTYWFRKMPILIVLFSVRGRPYAFIFSISCVSTIATVLLEVSSERIVHKNLPMPSSFLRYPPNLTATSQRWFDHMFLMPRSENTQKQAGARKFSFTYLIIFHESHFIIHFAMVTRQCTKRIASKVCTVWSIEVFGSNFFDRDAHVCVLWPFGHCCLRVPPWGGSSNL